MWNKTQAGLSSCSFRLCSHPYASDLWVAFGVKKKKKVQFEWEVWSVSPVRLKTHTRLGSFRCLSRKKKRTGREWGELKSKGRAGVCSVTHWAIHFSFSLLNLQIEYNNLLWTARVSMNMDLDTYTDVDVFTHRPLNKRPLQQRDHEEVIFLSFLLFLCFSCSCCLSLLSMYFE